MNVLLMLSLTTVLADELLGVSLDFAPTEVNSLATYTITFTTVSGAATDTVVRIVFPEDVQMTDSSNYSCTVTNLLNPPTNPYCTATANVVEVFNMFENGEIVGQSFFPLSVSVADVQNPRSVKPSDYVQVFTLTAAGDVIDYSPETDDLIINAEQATMAAAQILPSQDTIGALTSWTFSFTPKNSIPAGSSLQVVFPYWNKYIEASGGQLRHFIRVTSPACTKTASSPICSYSSSTLTLTMEGGFASETSEAVELVVSSVYNPPSPWEITGFVFTLYDSEGWEMEVSEELALTVSTPNVINGMDTLRLNQVVSASTTYYLSFLLSNPVFADCIVEVTFPPEVTLGASLSVEGFSNIEADVSVSILSSSTVRILNGFLEYKFPSTSIIIEFSPVTNPSTTELTGAFTVTTLTPDLLQIDSATGGTFNAVAGDLTAYQSNALVAAELLTVGEVTVYTFDFVTSHEVPSGGLLVVEFPPEITAADRSSAACSSIVAGLVSAAQCEVTSNVLTITGGFPTSFAPGRISFTLDNVQNALAAVESSSFSIATYADDTLAGQIDAESSGITVTAVPTPLKSVTVATSSSKTGELSTFTFEIEITNVIPQDGHLYVSFPTDVYITDTAAATDSCVKLAGFNEIEFDCQPATDSVSIYAFDNGSFTTGVLSFSIGSVKNPPSTAPHGSFVVTTYDDSGFKVDETSDGIFVQVTEPNTLVSAEASPSSVVNSVQTTYNFIVTPYNILYSGSKVKILPPATVEFLPNPTCTAVAGITAASCVFVDSANIEVTLTSDAVLASGEPFTFTVSPVTNPPTTEETGSFTLHTSTGDDYAVDSLLEGVTIQTSQGTPLSTLAITAGDSLIGVTTTYTLTFNTENEYPAGTTLLITIPAEFTVGTVLCSSPTLASAACSQASHEIFFSEGFTSLTASGTLVNITLTAITNPLTAEFPTSAWHIVTKTGTFIVDEDNEELSYLTCYSPCLTCQDTPDFCLSCDSDSAFPYLYDDTCHSECDVGETDPISSPEKLCEPCLDPCVECQDATDKCTVCADPTPYLYADTCHAECTETQYGDGSNCYDCPNPCFSCADASTCTSCAILTGTSTQTFLSGSDCVSDCGDGMYGDPDSLTCEACGGECTTCVDASTYCTTCSDGKKALEGTCVLSCPTDGRYIDINDVCEPCLDPCATCSEQLTTCTSCIENYYLHGGQCLTDCPLGTYQGPTKCYACVSPCENCSQGTTLCDSCVDGYLLQAPQCVTECSSGYLSNGVECSECTSPCDTCQFAVDQCTSCEGSLFLLDSGCVDSCPEGTHVPSAGVCEECNSTCLTCSGDPDSCETCPTGTKLYGTTCVSACPAGTTVEVDGACQSCNTNCAECATTVNTCTACNSPSLLEGGQCVSACSVGYVEVSGICEECNAECYECSGSQSTCSSCPQGTYLYNGSCVTDCPEGYLAVAGECYAEVTECATGCTPALYTNDICDPQCNVEECLYDNKICDYDDSLCDPGYYEISGECFACVYPCSNCLSDNTCTSCAPDQDTGKILLLHQDECVTTCPVGTAQTGYICEDCYTTCSECDGSANNECTVCKDGYYFYNYQCVSFCPQETTIQVGNECLDCDSNCATCDSSLENCTSCNSDKVLQGSLCKAACDSGYTTTSTDTGECQACVGCTECEGEVTSCTACASSEYLYNSNCLSECPGGTYASGNACKDCQSSCVLCSGDNNCSVCASGYYKYSTLCLSTCPEGYTNNNGICVLTETGECATGCDSSLLNNQECDEVCNVIDCSYDNEYCLDSECQPGEYLSDTTCQSCIYPCNTCKSETYCTACMNDVDTGAAMYAYNGGCVAECPAATAQIGVACVDCDASCVSCAESASTCTECPTGQVIYEGDCVDSCPAGITILLGDVCEPCSGTCATCEDTIDTCTSCPSGMILDGSECSGECPDGYSTSSSNPDSCELCSENCLTCEGELDACTSCDASKFHFESACYDACPAGDSIEVDGVCQACVAPCAQCVLTTTTCTSCDNGYALFNYECVATCPDGFEDRAGVCEPYCSSGCSFDLLYNGECDAACNTEECAFDNSDCVRSDCEKDQFLDGMVCADCHPSCSACSDYDYCTSCKVTDVQMLLYQGECLSECPSGTYKSGATCQSCASPCSECVSAADSCLACESSLVLYNSQCLDACPSGTIELTAGICSDCDAACAECSGEIDYCTQCYDNAFASAGNCVEECAEGFVLGSGGACETCPSPCFGCSGDECISCNSGQVLHEGTCLDECPTGFTTTPLSPSTCVACSSECASCSESMFLCTDCEAPLTVTVSSTCETQSSCPSDFLTNEDGSCTPCDSPCATCSNTSDNCLSCAEGYLEVGSACTQCESPCRACAVSLDSCTACFDGFYLSGSTCEVCDSSCRTCEGSASTCTSCDDGYLFDSSSNTCEACDDPLCGVCAPNVATCLECLEGAFFDNFVCTACESTCLTCEGSSVTCTSCPSGSFLTGANECEACDSTCAECLTTATNCIECGEGEELVDGTCGTCSSNCLTCAGDFNTCASCTEGLTLLNGQCGECSSDCLTCVNNFSTCGSCPDSEKLLDGTCVSSCPEGYYSQDFVCYTCASTCTACTSAQCTSCQEGYEISGTTCVLACDTGEYLFEEECVPCPDTCTACTASGCTGCVSGKELYEGSCLDECESGYSRVDSVECIECEPECLACSGTVDYCTECSDSELVLYDGRCLEECPAAVTVLVTGVCYDCEGNCLTCSVTPLTCTSCNPDFYLFEDSCFEACPEGYDVYDGVCCKEDCEPDEISDEFEPGTTPFPFTAASGVGVGIIAASKLSAGGIQFIPASVGVWSVFATVSWIALFGLVADEGEDRRLMASVTDGNMNTAAASMLILIALVAHYSCNGLFLYKFVRRVIREDRAFFYWRQRHRVMTWVVLIASGGLSFHCIRLLYCGLFRKDMFSASFDNKPSLVKLVVFFCYIHMLCVCVPLIASQILLLDHFPLSNWLWMFSLDSLIVTLFLLLLLVIDTIMIEKYLSTIRQALNPDAKRLMDSIYNTFTFKDLPNLAPPPYTQSLPGSQFGTPRNLQRKNSFPLLCAESKDVDYEAIDQVLRRDMELIKPKGKPNEFESTCRIYKQPVPHYLGPPYTELKWDPDALEFEVEYELVAYTEEASDEEIVKLETIQEEDEIDLNLAIADANDPEKVSVIHKGTGERITIRKDFKGARLVDLEGKVIDGSPAVDPADYHIPSTIVDQHDPRFATLVAHSGGRVRVKRSFNGARIVDLEKKVHSPFAYLLGRTVESEHDFNFDAAQADPKDPEVVIVTHKGTGEEVRIRKTFDGARVVDSTGQPIESEPPIDQTEYDIKTAKVDRTDIHLATLQHKRHHTRVRVRRDFRGAKVVDLERKSEQPSELSRSFANYTGWLSATHERFGQTDSGLQPIKLMGTQQTDRERLFNMVTVINNYEESLKEWNQLAEDSPTFHFAEEVGSGDKASRQRFKRPVYHNLDLERIYKPEDPSQIDSSRSNSSPPKRKLRVTGETRLKDLEQIYLPRQSVRKSDSRNTHNLNELEDFSATEQPRGRRSSVPRPVTQGGTRKFSAFGEEIIRRKR